MEPPKVDHICLAVRNLPAAQALLQVLLGKPGPDMTYEDDIAKVQVARHMVGEVGLELIADTTVDGPTAKFIAAKGEGIMVLGLNVPSTHAALDELERGGYPLIADPVHGAGSFLRRSAATSASCTQRDSTACSWKSSTTKSRSPKRLAPPGRRPHGMRAEKSIASTDGARCCVESTNRHYEGEAMPVVPRWFLWRTETDLGYHPAERQAHGVTAGSDTGYGFERIFVASSARNDGRLEYRPVALTVSCQGTSPEREFGMKVAYACV